MIDSMATYPPSASIHEGDVGKKPMATGISIQLAPPSSSRDAVKHDRSPADYGDDHLR